MSDPVSIKDAADATVGIAADDVAGFGRVQVVKLLLGADGASGGLVAAGNAVPVSGPLTDAQLRASAVPVSGPLTDAQLRAAAVPVSGPLTDAQLRAAAVPIAGNVTSPPSGDAAGAVVRQAPVDVFVSSFAGVGSGLLTPDMTQRRLGTGVGVTQGSGNLLVTTGTTTNAEFLARSVRSFNGALIMRAQTTLSQRIANTNFLVLLADSVGEGLAYTINSATSVTVTLTAHGLSAQNVGQSMFLGAITGAAGVPGRYAIAAVPTADTITFTVAGWPASGSGTLDLFGWNHYKLHYTSTVATNALFDAQRRGWASGDTTLTINTTAAPGHIAHVANDGRNAYVADMLAATSATPTITTRGSRFANMPDPDVELYLYLWSYNGTVAPASTTTWTVGFVSVEDTTNNVVYLGGVRQQGQAAPMPTSIVGTVALAANTPTLAAGTNLAGDVGTQYRANATGAASVTNFVALGSANPTVLKASAGRLLGYHLTNNATAVRYVKLHNIATSPTAGTTAVVGTIGIPPNGGTVAMNLPGGIGFATGIALTTVTGAAANDATAVAANDIVGTFIWA